MNVAVVGHVEWVEFARVEHVPAPGEIVHALETWEEAGGRGRGRGRPARESQRLLPLLHRARRRRARPALARGARGARRHGARGQARGPQRRAFTYVDDGRRADDHRARRQAPALRRGRRRCRGRSSRAATPSTSSAATSRRCARRAASRVLVATARELATLRRAAVRGRRARRERGGRRRALRAGRARAAAADRRHDGRRARRLDPPGRAVPRGAAPGPVADAYGCGDCFAAGLTYGLGGRAPGRRSGRARRPLRRGGPHGPRRLRSASSTGGRISPSRGGQVEDSGLKWGEVVEKGEPPHAPRRIRAHDRRQEPADAAGQVPPGVRGRDRRDARHGRLSLRLHAATAGTGSSTTRHSRRSTR